MKKINFLPLILIVFTGQLLFAQKWAPIGATWYYGYKDNPSSNIKGYRKIVSQRDTFIYGKQCRVLRETTSYKPASTYEEFYMYENNGKLYYYNTDSLKFITLYDFSKKAGQAWYLGWHPIDSIYVSSVDSMKINGHTLKVQMAADRNHGGLAFGGKMIEHIGCDYYMFPVVDCTCDDYGPLRCYQDSVIGYFNFTPPTSCDQILTNIANILSQENGITFNNPVLDKLEIQFPHNGVEHIAIYNILGERINKVEADEKNNSSFIDVSHLPAGVYVFNLSTKANSIISKKFIKL